MFLRKEMEESPPYEDSNFEAFLRALPIITFVGLFALGSSFFGIIKYQRNTKLKDMKMLVQQAAYLSTGEDGIWSQKEKRQFLDYNGMRKAIINEGQGLYFKGGLDAMEVVVGNNLESEGLFLKIQEDAKTGKRKDLGTRVGVINEAQIRDYMRKQIQRR